MEFTVYLDDEGLEVFTSPGISGGQYFMTVRRKKPNGPATKRVVSKDLPLRPTQEEAQADLDAYAAKKKWGQNTNIKN